MRPSGLYGGMPFVRVVVSNAPTWHRELVRSEAGQGAMLPEGGVRATLQVGVLTFPSVEDEGDVIALIGMDLLSKARLAIDGPGKTVMIVPPESHASSGSPPRRR